MSDTGPALVYLEADDEITTVVRRLRGADAERVVIVAPGRSRATSSAVALRLLARAAEAEGRRIAVVGDPLTRSLAAEAGLATYATVHDARSADPDAPVAQVERKSAAISVVRGPQTDDTAPTLTALAAGTPPARSGRDDETVVVPTPVAAREVAVRRRLADRQRRRRVAPERQRAERAAAIVAGAVLVVIALLVGAFVLPAASISIAPRTVDVGPVVDTIEVPEPQRVAGVAERSVTATATEPYEAQEPATGGVIFFNWNFLSVQVPAGALVAAGEQAFETLETITVPNGEFDPFQGGITAGEARVGVRAVAPGPDANVEAGAIDTVLNQNLAAQLRGFPTITEPLVTNPEPTSGGLIESGVEFSQADVDAAVDQLRTALEDAVADELAVTDGMVVADAGEPPAPQIEVPDDLVGSREAETVEIAGSLAYDRLAADPDEVIRLASERFAADPVLPDGWDLVADATEVAIGEARREGDRLLVDITVSGRAAPSLEREDVLPRVIGLGADEAEAALVDLGTARVELWPPWVSTVPDNEWRISLEVAEPEASPSP